MNWLLAAASGFLLVVLHPGFDFDFLAPFALVPLLFAVAKEPQWKVRLALGVLCGFIFWIGICHWIRPVLAAYGGLSAGLAWLTLILFALAKALHMAVFAAIAGLLIARPWAIPALAALWVGIERTHSTFGFAWLTLGDAGVDMSIPARLAPMVGVYGISFLFVLLNVAVALILLRRPRRELFWLLPVLLIFLLPEMPSSSKGRRIAVALQPNLTERDSPSLLALGTRSALASVGADLIVWPEVPAGFYWDRDTNLREAMDRLARWTSKPVLFGGVTHDDRGRPLNSAVLIGEDGKERGRYSKTNLVPFGEFIPPLFGWITKISTEAGDFTPGDGARTLDTIGAFICYESAFPHYVRQFAPRGAKVLVNMSNDGWFFQTAAREQHLQLVRMRAIENRRWIVRATNNGITAAIDPAGRVEERQPEFRSLAARLHYDEIAETTLYSRFGDWFAWGCLAVSVGLLFCPALALSQKRKPATGSPG